MLIDKKNRNKIYDFMEFMTNDRNGEINVMLTNYEDTIRLLVEKVTNRKCCLSSTHM